MTYLSQDTRSPGQDFRPGPSEYETEFSCYLCERGKTMSLNCGHQQAYC
jgi:hypothetical protein